MLFIKSCSGELCPLHNHAIKPPQKPPKTPRTLSVFAQSSYKGDYVEQKVRLMPHFQLVVKLMSFEIKKGIFYCPLFQINVLHLYIIKKADSYGTEITYRHTEF